jgi:hypothetical protein
MVTFEHLIPTWRWLGGQACLVWLQAAAVQDSTAVMDNLQIVSAQQHVWMRLQHSQQQLL